jgi:hypothetical protein
MFRVMPVSLEFLRGVLGVLAIFFAQMAGRACANLRKGKQKLRHFNAWVLRTLVCAVVVSIRHPIGVLDIAVWVLCAAGFGWGWRDTSRERPNEDLTNEIFPENR